MTIESGESSEALGPLFPLLPDLRLLFSTYCHGFLRSSRTASLSR